MRRHLLLTAAALLPVSACLGIARAQTTHQGPEAAIALAKTLAPFDVVSVRVHDASHDPPNQINTNMTTSDAIFHAENVPLELVIEFAYDVRSDQISGLSGPVSNARFDIEAKVLPGPDGKLPKLSDAQLAAMILPLLADRFHLQAHLQQKTLPVYELVVGRGGPKFKLSADAPNDASWNMNWSNNDKILTAKKVSMADLATALGDEVHRKVIDKTGLTGSADLTLKWADDLAAQAGGPNVISVFTAVEEQLGLKLQPSRGPVETLVIDHAEMPSAN